MTAAPVRQLVLAAAVGVWAVRSTSQTVYYVDADRSLLLRRTGPGSSPGFADDRWAPLVLVESLAAGDVGVIRVGDRHRFIYDFDPGGDQHGFWIQRLVTSIAPVAAAELADLPDLHRGDPS